MKEVAVLEVKGRKIRFLILGSILLTFYFDAEGAWTYTKGKEGVQIRDTAELDIPDRIWGKVKRQAIAIFKDREAKRKSPQLSLPLKKE